MSNNSEIPVNLKLALFGGAGIGLLFGVIMGTSVTPTVATILGALTTLLAGILGLNDQHFNNTKAVRIGGFGFACVLGAYLGLFVRANNVFSPSIISMKASYIAAGFSEQQALNFIAYKEFGIALTTSKTRMTNVSEKSAVAEDDITSSGVENDAEPIVSGVEISMLSSHANKQHSSVLFSAPVEISGCDELAYTDNTLPLDEILNNFELTGGVWEELSTRVQNRYRDTSEQEQKSLLLLVRDTACKVDVVTKSHCADLALAIDKENFNDVVASVKQVGQQWSDVASDIEQVSLPPAMKLSILTEAKNIVCGAS
ncbi:MAG: hypothetical protein ACI9LM_003453 [Alteromonadaceae bacterium]|jgi:hypothetical protein